MNRISDTIDDRDTQNVSCLTLATRGSCSIHEQTILNSVKSATLPKDFKSHVKSALITDAFYGPDEFMARNYET